MVKIHLGAGEDIREGYINIDLYKLNGIDKIFDLNKIPYPFKKNTVDEIVANYLLEHLDDTYNMLLEWHRICKDGAIIKLKTPHFSNADAWNDLQHRKGFGTKAFNHNNMSDKFQLLFQRLTFPKQRGFMRWFANKYPGFYDYNLAYLFPARELLIFIKFNK